MAIEVKRESLDTKSQHVSPAYVDKDGVHYLTSSDKPFPTIDVNHLRMHEGRAYYVYKLFPYAAGLAAGASIDIAIACDGDAVFCAFKLGLQITEVGV